MKSFYGIYGIVGALGATTASTFQIQPRDNATEFTRFAQDIGLPAAQIESVRVKFSQATKVELACLTAQFLIGIDNVDTVPLNETIVEENW